MRAVEREFVRRRSEESRRAMAAELERHRLAYVYFLNRLVDAAVRSRRHREAGTPAPGGLHADERGGVRSDVRIGVDVALSLKAVGGAS